MYPRTPKENVMRTSRVATITCAAVLGLGTLISQTAPAFAGPTPPMVLDQGGDNIEVGELDWKAPTPTTPPTVPEMDLVLPEVDDDPKPELAPPMGTFDATVVGDGVCTPGTVPDPDCVPDDDCNPSTVCPPEDDCVPVPGAADCPPPGGDCETYVECCEEDKALDSERPCPGDEDPCDEDGEQGPTRSFEDCCVPDDGSEGQAVRHREDCDGEDPCVERPEDDEPGKRDHDDEDCCIERPEGGDEPSKRSGDSRNECPPDTGTDGSDGTTDGGGRLPKTGAEMATYGLAGLGFVGIGAALKRLGRKKA
jgi:LPXTG-motif cell wall-anchored protein